MSVKDEQIELLQRLLGTPKSQQQTEHVQKNKETQPLEQEKERKPIVQEKKTKNKVGLFGRVIRTVLDY